MICGETKVSICAIKEFVRDSEKSNIQEAYLPKN